MLYQLDGITVHTHTHTYIFTKGGLPEDLAAR